MHSGDKTLSAVGSQSNIPYQELFNAYKKILIVNSYNDDPITKELFRFYNSIVFHWEANGAHKAKTPCDDNEPYDSSGVEDAIRPRSVQTGGVPHYQDNNFNDSESEDRDLEPTTELPVPVCIEFTLISLNIHSLKGQNQKNTNPDQLRTAESSTSLPRSTSGSEIAAVVKRIGKQGE